MTRTKQGRHAIARVRQAIRTKVPNLSHLGTAKGFSAWIGRSESLLRNVESGLTRLSPKVAQVIAEKTGVSAEWLLSDPSDDQPILNVQKQVWEPSYHLDLLAGGGTRPNILRLIELNQNSVPMLLGKMIQWAVEVEMQFGSLDFIEALMKLLEQEHYFNDPEYAGKIDQYLKEKVFSDLKPAIESQIWNPSPDCVVRYQTAANGQKMMENVTPAVFELEDLRAVRKAKPRFRRFAPNGSAA